MNVFLLLRLFLIRSYDKRTREPFMVHWQFLKIIHFSHLICQMPTQWAKQSYISSWSCLCCVYSPPCGCACGIVCRAEMTSTSRFCTPSWSYTSSPTWTWFKLSGSSCGVSDCPARLRRSTAWWRRSPWDTAAVTLGCFRAQVQMCVLRRHQCHVNRNKGSKKQNLIHKLMLIDVNGQK